jgi:hypothetical protein
LLDLYPLTRPASPDDLSPQAAVAFTHLADWL